MSCISKKKDVRIRRKKQKTSFLGNMSVIFQNRKEIFKNEKIVIAKSMERRKRGREEGKKEMNCC